MSAPDKFCIAWHNFLAGLTLESSVAAEAAYPITNLQNTEANEWAVFDMTGLTQLEIWFTSATPMLVNMLALHNHTIQSDGTAQFWLYAGEGETGDSFDSTVLDVPHTVPYGSEILGIDPLEGHFETHGRMKTHFAAVFEPFACRSGRIRIASAAWLNDALLIDKGFLSFAWCPPDSPEWGWNATQRNASQHQPKPGGGMDTYPDPPRRSLNVRFGGVPNTERHVIRHILDRAEMDGDLWVSVDPTDAQSQKYETTSIYRRTTETGFDAFHHNSNDGALGLEEN